MISLRTIAGFEKISCIFIGGKVASYIIYEMERHEFLLWNRGRPYLLSQRICFSADGLMVSKKHCAFLQGAKLQAVKGEMVGNKMRWWQPCGKQTCVKRAEILQRSYRDLIEILQTVYRNLQSTYRVHNLRKKKHKSLLQNR